jgi:hypothetical protein
VVELSCVVIRVAASLKYRDGLSRPGSVVARIGHALSSTMNSSLRKSMRFEIGCILLEELLAPRAFNQLDVILNCHGYSDYGTSL